MEELQDLNAQQKLDNNQINNLIKGGYSKEEAMQIVSYQKQIENSKTPDGKLQAPIDNIIKNASDRVKKYFGSLR